MWAPITVLAAIALLARNALQSGLTAEIGTLGATMVRFVYAMPWVILFHAIGMVMTGGHLPDLTMAFLAPVAGGAFGQIGGTALMLRAMHLRGFAVANAYIKMEPVLLALGGWWLLGDALSLLTWAGIAIATAGVLVAAIPAGAGLAALRGQGGAIVIGLGAAALFGFSALCYRAGVLAAGDGPAVLRALHVLLATILIQSVTMVIWLGIANPGALTGSLRQWRFSTVAGVTGAIASLGWFTAFGMTAAANVRTLALVDLPLAALIQKRMTGAAPSRRELGGIAAVIVGIAVLLWAELA